LRPARLFTGGQAGPPGRSGTVGPAAAAAAVLIALAASGCTRASDDQLVARIDGFELTAERFQDYFKPPSYKWGTREQSLEQLNQILDRQIGDILVMQAGFRRHLDRVERFQRRHERYLTDVLNESVKLLEIESRIQVSPAEADSFLQRSRRYRHLLHIPTAGQAGTTAVREALTRGDDWAELAKRYSADPQVNIHQGDLGWVGWGYGTFQYYPSLQDTAFKIPVGRWAGPITEGPHAHFIMVLADSILTAEVTEQERDQAARKVAEMKRRNLEQAFSNRIWGEWELRLNEDQLRWLYDRLNASYESDPANNPLPRLSREDGRRVIVSTSQGEPLTAAEILNRLELMLPSSRDKYLQLGDWRKQVFDWAIGDAIAAYARRKGYHRRPEVRARMQAYTESQVTSRMLEQIQDTVPVPDDSELLTFVQENPEQFNIPSRRLIVEVRAATREDAEEILRRARGGAPLEQLAAPPDAPPGAAPPAQRRQIPSTPDPDPLAEAVFTTPVGEFGPVVESGGGYSVFKVEREMPAVRFNPNDARQMQTLRDTLRGERQQQAVDEFVEQERARARIWKNRRLLDQIVIQFIDLATPFSTGVDSAGVGR
jgi:parvulin-like peptidyl-prolyl isomerase